MIKNATDPVDWIKLIGGGFAHMTAPFVLHPNDRQRAKEYLEQAKKHELTVADAIGHAREYLRTSIGWPTDEDDQIRRVEAYFSGNLPRK